MKSRKGAILLTIFTGAAFGVVGEAKQLNLTNGSMGAYFGGDIGTSQVDRTAFEEASGGANFQYKVRYQLGGQLGFMYSTQKYGIRLGVLLLSPQVLNSIDGTNSAGATQYNLTSTILGVLPAGYFEYIMSNGSSNRLMLVFGGGFGSVTILNDYKFTAAGRTTYSLTDFIEEAKADVGFYEAGAGYEMLLNNNVSTMFDLGYRYLVATDFQHQRGAATFIGSVNTNDAVKNSGGSKRQINLSSLFIGLTFRFYFNF